MSAILGISGLSNSIAFKRAHWGALEEREYRISQGHDAAAALVVDGKVVAAEAEERFNRKKHSGDFPIQAISYCLTESGLSLADIDAIVHAFDYSPYNEIYSLDPISSRLYQTVLSREALLGQIARNCEHYPAARVYQVGHHLSHAASAYLTSGWDECLVVVIDAMGEMQSASIFRAENGRLEKIREISANDSIGILYSVVTLHLGFDFNSDEYKIMGLAPYGDPCRYAEVFRRAIELRPEGMVRVPILRINRTRDERENYSKTREWLAQNLIAPRAPSDPINQDHCDVAAALQACLDNAVLHLCGHFAKTTGLPRLAMAGGVALNCTANGKLMRSGLFEDVYIQPAAGDDGAALGAALYHASLQGEAANERSPVPLLGPGYTSLDIAKALTEFDDKVVVLPFEDLAATCAEAARLIEKGNVIAWYRGRMEFGPRALGNRSILADPGHPEMRDRINAMVKKREAFRPFAPAVSIEEVDRWFDVPPATALPYMIFTVDVRAERRAALPAITHINGSARVQTVSVADNADFHVLLEAVGKTTGRQMVLNTRNEVSVL